ncbi:MAG TPA: helix-turn-helix domain-containing protein, partial [Verrucomicrobiae bacterium]|nr:helix-turn-helix domain-containing protein [Verrucomicrobiae bacterium]
GFLLACRSGFVQRRGGFVSTVSGFDDWLSGFGAGLAEVGEKGWVVGLAMNETQNAPTTGAPEKSGGSSFTDAAGLAARLGVSIGTIRNWTKRGALPAVRLNCGRLVRYHLPTVEQALLQSQRGQ